MKHITFRLKPGDLLKESIENTITEKGIKAGALLSVVGGLENVVLRMAGSVPDKQIVKKWDGPFEIVSGTGTLSENGCHIHISVSDAKGTVVGGHLKDGCKVKTTAEIVLGVFDDVVYKRTPDENTGFAELNVQDI